MLNEICSNPATKKGLENSTAAKVRVITDVNVYYNPDSSSFDAAEASS